MHMKRSTLVVACISALLCIFMARAAVPQSKGSQVPPKEEQSKAAPLAPPEGESVDRGDVVIEGRRVLSVYQRIGEHSPQERASQIATRIASVARDKKISPDDIRIFPQDAWSEILVGNTLIVAVTDTDAQLAGRPRDEMAKEYAGNIRKEILNYRREHSLRTILLSIAYTILTTLTLVPIVWLLRRIRITIRSRLERNLAAALQRETKTARGLIGIYLGSLALGIGHVIRWVLVLAVIQIYLAVVLGYFSVTRDISLKSTSWVFSQVSALTKSGLNYLPNLLVIFFIGLAVHFLIRIVRVIFDGIDRGNISIPGFYPDWAKPTDKLVRLLIIALALIITFPYLPGPNSRAFQGVSIFLGVLLSLGSSSSVANAIAGVILTYMRSFLLGDWVSIGGSTGEVIEKNLLVTRIRTPKEEIITIANSSVMSGAVQNFSAKARESGVIFHTTISIGYDAPWRMVHSLLINAALTTENIQHVPEPFVLQTALNDFYVTYELNAYTLKPILMLTIYSELHQNIQDKFNEAGVEICSPHFSSHRDGNVIAIPSEYVRSDYKPSAFRVNLTKPADE